MLVEEVGRDFLLEAWEANTYCENCDPPYGVILDLYGNGVKYVMTKKCGECTLKWLKK